MTTTTGNLHAPLASLVETFLAKQTDTTDLDEASLAPLVNTLNSSELFGAENPFSGSDPAAATFGPKLLDIVVPATKMFRADNTGSPLIPHKGFCLGTKGATGRHTYCLKTIKVTLRNILSVTLVTTMAIPMEGRGNTIFIGFGNVAMSDSGTGTWLDETHVPKILWIGCSDARVPESVAKLGTQVFVHRNIANQFHLTDINAGSVLTYGMTGIKNDPIVEIRIVGHSDCGGVDACHAAANGKDVGIHPSSLLWTWLAPLRVLADSYKDKPTIHLARENVRVQVRNVKEALRRLGINRPVTVKGYVYLIEKDDFEVVV